MDEVSTWVDGAPWAEYQVRRTLLGQPETDEAVRKARLAMLAHPRVQALLAELSEWPGPPLKRHNDAGHLLHKLAFVADLGVRADDLSMPAIAGRVLERQSSEGPLQVGEEVSAVFGGSGAAEAVWFLCDAPTVLYALVKMGLGRDARVRQAVGYLAGLVRDNGWPCVVCPQLGGWRGPGRKSDPCPYATLLMLKLLGQMPEWSDSPAARSGAETLLHLWDARRAQKPYLFAMGSDFSKLKAPLVWYDMVHVLDVLTQFPWLHGDARLHEMLAIVQAKADAQGRFTPESVWRAWAEWDFGQKKAPSPWLTLLIRRLTRRVPASAGRVAGPSA